jgi:hypothetical protein
MNEKTSEKHNDKSLEVNQLFIKILEDLAKEAAFVGNRKLNYTYVKAIRSLKKCKTPLTCGRDAMRLDGVGKVIAAKLDYHLALHRQRNTSETSQLNDDNRSNSMNKDNRECFESKETNPEPTLSGAELVECFLRKLGHEFVELYTMPLLTHG